MYLVGHPTPKFVSTPFKPIEGSAAQPAPALRLTLHEAALALGTWVTPKQTY